jgi:hypothetical protein
MRLTEFDRTYCLIGSHTMSRISSTDIQTRSLGVEDLNATLMNHINNFLIKLHRKPLQLVPEQD